MEAKESPVVEPRQDENRGGSQNPPIIGITQREDDPSQPIIPSVLPILPVRNMVIFPGTVIPLTVGRASSRKLLEESLPQSKIIGLFTQRNAEVDEAGPADLYAVGVAGQVLKLLRQSEDSVVIVVQALRRIGLRKFVLTHPFLKAEVETLTSVAPAGDDKTWEATVRNLRDTAVKLIELTPDVPNEAKVLLGNIEDPGLLADFLASNLNLEVEQKQDLLEERDVRKRVNAVQLRVAAQLEIATLQQKIQKDIASQFTDAQRRAYLREQIKAIQRELGEEGPGSDEQAELLRKRLQESKPPAEVM